ncbi:hypothetical protein KAR91_09350 [Candidatus Pacearchaeota archaeon]|nr:hypothetical protein [Candidatus Pacearchaeota archaeon]
MGFIGLLIEGARRTPGSPLQPIILLGDALGLTGEDTITEELKEIITPENVAIVGGVVGSAIIAFEGLKEAGKVLGKEFGEAITKEVKR